MNSRSPLGPKTFRLLHLPCEAFAIVKNGRERERERKRERGREGA